MVETFDDIGAPSLNDGEQRLRLINPDDKTDTIDVTPNLLALSGTKEHSAMASLDFTTAPAEPLDILDRVGDRVQLYQGTASDVVKIFDGELLAPDIDFGGEQTTFETLGWGKSLKDAETRRVYRDAPLEFVIEDFVSNELPDFWTWNVTSPSVEKVQDNETLFDTAQGDEFGTDLFDDVADTDPIVIDTTNNNARAAQTCWTTEGEAFDRESNPAVGPYSPSDFGNVSAGNWSGAQFIALTGDPEWVEYDFELEHKIKAENLGLKIRDRFREDNDGDYLRGDLIFSIDGTEVLNASVEAGNSNADIDPFGEVSLDWRDRIDSGVELAEGSHTLRIEAVSNRSTSAINTYLVDVVAPYDTRYSYNFDSNTDSNDALAGPELYPDVAPVQMTDEEFGNNVESVEITASFTDATFGDSAEWRARNNDTDNYLTDSAASPSFDFEGADMFGFFVDTVLGFSRYSSGGTSTPTDGDKPTEITDLSVALTTNDREIVEGKLELDGDILSILRDDLHRGDWRFAIEHDNPTPVGYSFRRGDETRDVNYTVLDMDLGISIKEYWNGVTVESRRRPDGRLTDSRDVPMSELSSVEQRIGRKRKRRTIPEIIDDRGELRRERERLIREGLSGFSYDINIKNVARDITPGFSIYIDEVGEYVPLEKVDFDLGDESGSLSLGRDEETTDTQQNVASDERGTRKSIGEDLTNETAIQPGSVAIIDDFEDGNLSEYVVLRGSPDIQSDKVAEGDKALRLPPDTGVISSSGLENYPSRGDVFRFEVATEPPTDNDITSELLFATDRDTGGAYRCSLGIGDVVETGEAGLALEISDGEGKSASNSFFLSDPYGGRFFSIEVEFDPNSSGEIKARLLDSGAELITVSITDTKFDDGGVLFGTRASRPEEPDIFFDYARITSSST